MDNLFSYKNNLFTLCSHQMSMDEVYHDDIKKALDGICYWSTSTFAFFLLSKIWLDYWMFIN